MHGSHSFCLCSPLSLVESFIMLLRQCLLCHKEPAPRIQSPLLGAFCLLLAGSLWHKDSWLSCPERSYYRRPYAIKNQRGAKSNAMRRAFFLWHKRHCSSSSEKSSTSRWTTLLCILRFSAEYMMGNMIKTVVLFNILPMFFLTFFNWKIYNVVQESVFST